MREAREGKRRWAALAVGFWVFVGSSFLLALAAHWILDTEPFGEFTLLAALLFIAGSIIAVWSLSIKSVAWVYTAFLRIRDDRLVVRMILAFWGIPALFCIVAFLVYGALARGT